VKVYELATNLTELGHDVFLFLPKLGYPEVQTSSHVVSVPYVDLSILRYVSFQIVSFLMALRILKKVGRPSVVYVRIMRSFVPMALAKFIGVPTILEINDSPHDAYAAINNKGKRRLTELIDRISFRLSHHFLPVTEQIASNLHNVNGIPYNKITVIVSGTNTRVFRPLSKSFCCKKVGLDEGYKYIGFIGTFFRHQGIDTLIDGAAMMTQEIADIRFLLVGDGPMRGRWMKRIDKMGLSQYFYLTGHVPYNQVPIYCGVMDICVAPALNEAGERSPVKAFDYLACGKPVIMSDVSKTGRFFVESGGVALVPPEDAKRLSEELIDLLSDHGRMEEMGKRGRNYVISRYDRKLLATQIEGICQRIGELGGVIGYKGPNRRDQSNCQSTS
jgi:glycosyltransferase involved in cell wall biosynthesis